eukprot:567832-Pyramimonas_sp.AAC.1
MRWVALLAMLGIWESAYDVFSRLVGSLEHDGAAGADPDGHAAAAAAGAPAIEGAAAPLALDDEAVPDGLAPDGPDGLEAAA